MIRIPITRDAVVGKEEEAHSRLINRFWTPDLDQVLGRRRRVAAWNKKRNLGRTNPAIVRDFELVIRWIDGWIIETQRPSLDSVAP